MESEAALRKRKSLRLKEYDYSSPGYYFITVCTMNRFRLFGDILGGGMRRNAAGDMVDSYWGRLPKTFSSVELDEHVIMPNHIHGIVILQDVGAAPCGRPNNQDGRPHGDAPTLNNMIDWFKTMTTNAYIRNVRKNHWQSFPGKLWQRSYFDRIIRNEDELYKIREYIINNPLAWEFDLENSDCKASYPQVNEIEILLEE